MKLQIYNKTVESFGRFVAIFTCTPQDRYLDFANGYNSQGCSESINIEYTLPKSLKNYFEHLGLCFPGESGASLHTSLYTICDPNYFNKNNMDRVFIIELLNDDKDFRIIEVIENFSDWFTRFPYPKEN